MVAIRVWTTLKGGLNSKVILSVATTGPFISFMISFVREM